MRRPLASEPRGLQRVSKAQADGWAAGQGRLCCLLFYNLKAPSWTLRTHPRDTVLQFSLRSATREAQQTLIEGRTHRCGDEVNGGVEGGMDGRKDGWVGGWMERWMVGGSMDERTEGQVIRRKDDDKRTDEEWLDWWMDR